MSGGWIPSWLIPPELQKVVRPFVFAIFLFGTMFMMLNEFGFIDFLKGENRAGAAASQHIEQHGAGAIVNDSQGVSINSGNTTNTTNTTNTNTNTNNNIVNIYNTPARGEKPQAEPKVTITDFRCEDCLVRLQVEATGRSEAHDGTEAKILAERDAMRRMRGPVKEWLGKAPYNIAPDDAAGFFDSGGLTDESRYGREGNVQLFHAVYEIRVPKY